MNHKTKIKKGIYIEEIGSIITLDNLSTKLNVYNLKCQF
jgi:hypothetical protein